MYIPESAVQWLLSGNERKNAAAAGAPHGERHDTLIRYLGGILERNPAMGLEELIDLAYGWNRKNDPPVTDPKDFRKMEAAVRCLFESDKRNHPERYGRAGNDLTEIIKSYLSEQFDREISLKAAYSEIGARIPDEQRQVRNMIYRECEKGNFEHVEGRTGMYRRIDKTVTMNSWADSSGIIEAPSIRIPLDLHTQAKIPYGEMAVIGGLPNCSKTGFLVGLGVLNAENYKINFINSSETSAATFLARLKLFPEYKDAIRDGKFDIWKKNITHIDHANMDTLHHAISSPQLPQGRGVIHIVDYLEISRDFFEIGPKLNAIYRVLNGAIAFIAVQQTNAERILGNNFGLFKPSLAISLIRESVSGGIAYKAKILKNKIPANGNTTNDGKVCRFSISDGIPTRLSLWSYEK